MLLSKSFISPLISSRYIPYLNQSHKIWKSSSFSSESCNFPLKSLPSQVKIVEVGPRDGLQNEKKLIPSEIKIELIRRLSNTGLKVIEATSFVSPKWVPQMGDCQEVFNAVRQFPNFSNLSYPVLVPNEQGLSKALKCGVKEIAIFGAASESFSQKNLNASIEESLNRFKSLAKEAKNNNLKIRGYISCVFGCPFEGPTNKDVVAQIAHILYHDLGCYEISLGDTIGIATPGSTFEVINAVKGKIPTEAIAVHFHNTYGQALANILVSLQLGVSVCDSSIGGLGGCPYAPGATGNISTEDVVYMLESLNVKTGVNLDSLIEIGTFISDYLGQSNRSSVGTAVINTRKRKEEELKKNSCHSKEPSKTV